MKKVVCIIDNLNTGGAEQVFSDISILLLGHISFDILLILPPKGEVYITPPAIRKIFLNRSNKFSLYSLWKCYLILRNYDVAHVHLRHTLRYILLVKFIFNVKVKIVFHDHHGSIDIDKSQPYWGYSFLKPDIFIGVSNELNKWALDTWKLRPERVFTLINLPSERFLNKVYEDPTRLKSGTLVMVGNIKPVKNQLFAIRIAHQLGISLTLIGKNQHDEYGSEILTQIEKLGSIEWIQNIDDVSDLLQSYRLGIFCSKSESGPLVILEYLLCGLPFIAYKTGGISDVMSKYFPDFFVDTFEPQVWFDRITSLLKNPPEIDKSKVKKMLETEFNKENYRNKLMQIYEM